MVSDILACFNLGEKYLTRALSVGLDGNIAMGTLTVAADPSHVGREVKSLPSEYPVLQASIDPKYRAELKSQLRTGAALGIAGFYTPFGIAVTIALRLSNSHFHWLADPHDPEVWEMVDAWQEGRKVAFSFHPGGVEDCSPLFVTYPFQRVTGIERFRDALTMKPYPEIWTAIRVVAASGVLEEAGNNLRSNTRKQVHINALMTCHLKQVVNHDALCSPAD